MAKENTAEPNPFTHSVVLRVPGAEAVEVIQRDAPATDGVMVGTGRYTP